MNILPNITPTPIDLSFVAGLLTDVFGVNQPVFHPSQGDSSIQPDGFSQVELEPDAPEYDKAPIRYGQKTWGAFWLKGGSYLTFGHKGNLVNERFSDFMMPLATLVSFNRPKMVKKTTTPGGAGAVKEIFGLDDWSISINGIILPDYNNPPGQQTVEEQMDILQRFHEVAGSIEVEGQIFAKRNITRIVTDDVKFDPIQGKPNMMQFSIPAMSDVDLLLIDFL